MNTTVVSTAVHLPSLPLWPGAAGNVTRTLPHTPAWASSSLLWALILGWKAASCLLVLPEALVLHTAELSLSEGEGKEPGAEVSASQPAFNSSNSLLAKGY